MMDQEQHSATPDKLQKIDRLQYNYQKNDINLKIIKFEVKMPKMILIFYHIKKRIIFRNPAFVVILQIKCKTWKTPLMYGHVS